MNEEKILNLWRWFYANERRIRESIDNNLKDEQEIIVQNLDNFILDLGMFSWDIGPGENKAWFLTISPNGDKELLAKTKEIVAGAPELENREFNYAKPAKNWDRKLSIYDTDMEVRLINASDWDYVAIKDQNGMRELILEASNIKNLDEETANNAANLFVINEIGEEAKIKNISAISIVTELENKYKSKKLSIGTLKNSIDQ